MAGSRHWTNCRHLTWWWLTPTICPIPRLPVCATRAWPLMWQWVKCRLRGTTPHAFPQTGSWARTGTGVAASLTSRAPNGQSSLPRMWWAPCGTRATGHFFLTRLTPTNWWPKRLKPRPRKRLVWLAWSMVWRCGSQASNSFSIVVLKFLTAPISMLKCWPLSPCSVVLMPARNNTNRCHQKIGIGCSAACVLPVTHMTCQ